LTDWNYLLREWTSLLGLPLFWTWKK